MNRSTRVLALALLSSILAACGQQGGAGGGSGTSGLPGTAGSFHTEVVVGDIRLLAGRSVEGGALVVRYELHNAGSAPMLVHDRVPPSLGSAVLPEDLDPEKAWVFMGDSRVRVSKQGFDPAPGIRFIAEPVMGARVLEPGQGLSGSARVRLPIRLDLPGPEFEAPRAALDPEAGQLEFCVQVTQGSGGRPSGVDPTILEVPAASPRPDELVCSPPLDVPL